jgi:hypothetical protein
MAVRLELGGATKWIVIGILAIIFMAIFFYAFGKWFIPLMLMFAVVASMYLTGAHKSLPAWSVVMLPLVAFCLGYVMEKLTIVSMQAIGEPSLANISTAFLFGFLVIVLVVLMVISLTKSSYTVLRRR